LYQAGEHKLHKSRKINYEMLKSIKSKQIQFQISFSFLLVVIFELVKAAALNSAKQNGVSGRINLRPKYWS
jgi:hypothetical protein